MGVSTVPDENQSVVLHFELEEPGAAGDQALLAAELQQRLGQLDDVEAAQAKPDEQRFTGVEIVAGITAAVVIVRAGRELTEELTRLIPAIRALISEMKGIKGATVEVGDELVPLDQITDDQLGQIAGTA